MAANNAGDLKRNRNNFGIAPQRDYMTRCRELWRNNTWSKYWTSENINLRRWKHYIDRHDDAIPLTSATCHDVAMWAVGVYIMQLKSTCAEDVIQLAKYLLSQRWTWTTVWDS